MKIQSLVKKNMVIVKIEDYSLRVLAGEIMDLFRSRKDQLIKICWIWVPYSQSVKSKKQGFY